MLALTLSLLFLRAALAADIPEPTEDFYVYDGANVLTYETEGHIVFCNRELYDACGAQIVFVTVDTVGGETMDDYASRSINDWQMGDARKHNGFVVVLAIDDDDYYALTGTGLDLELSAGILKELSTSIWSRTLPTATTTRACASSLTRSLNAWPTSAARM